MSQPPPPAPATESARLSAPDPAPLGLAAFGMANLAQSFFGSGVDPTLNPAAFPLEFLTGGIVQLIAGIVEFRQGSRLGATAFSLYGSYWMSFAVYSRFIVRTLPAGQVHSATGYFLLPWTILTVVLTFAALRTTLVLLLAFVCAAMAFIFGTAGQFLQSGSLLLVGGSFGFLTAAVGLYAALAGLVNGTWGRHVLPTLPDPGRRLAHLAFDKARPSSITSSAGEAELAREAAHEAATLLRGRRD